MDDSHKAFDQELLKAYSRTIYQVQRPAYSIEIDQENDDLDVFLIDNNAHRYAFVTSSNPKSQVLQKTENSKRLDELKQLLNALSVRYCKAVHIDPTGKWENEESYFVLDISKDRAKAIGDRFGQHAIVYGGFKKPAQIIQCKG